MKHWRNRVLPDRMAKSVIIVTVFTYYLQFIFNAISLFIYHIFLHTINFLDKILTAIYKAITARSSSYTNDVGCCRCISTLYKHKQKDYINMIIIPKI